MRRAHSARLENGAVLVALVLLGGGCVARAQVADQPAAVRAGEDPEISRLHLDALKTEDPEEKLKIYDKILAKDPANVEARQGFKDAKVAAGQKRAALAEKAKNDEKQRADQARGRTALRAAESALYTGDIFGARQKLNEAKSFGQSGPDVLRIERIIANDEWKSKAGRFAGFGVGGVLFVGLLLWMVSLFRKGQPYVEVLTGTARGRRFPVEKDVLTIGALAQKGEEKNDVVVSDPEKTISRFHCEVHRKGKSFYVVDCKSANGTRLDGRAIPAGRLIPLKRGAHIQLGASCTLKFGFERRKR
jgi:FHA domain